MSDLCGFLIEISTSTNHHMTFKCSESKS